MLPLRRARASIQRLITAQVGNLLLHQVALDLPGRQEVQDRLDQLGRKVYPAHKGQQGRRGRAVRKVRQGRPGAYTMLGLERPMIH